MNNPPHVGEFIQSVYLDDGHDPKALAEQLSLTTAEFNRLLKGEDPITQSLAKNLSVALGGTIESWLNIQTEYDRSAKND